MPFHYQHHRKIAAYAVRPGDIVHLPHSGIVVEVYEVRLAVWVNPDTVAVPLTIFSIWRYDEHTGEERFNDNARQRRDGIVYVIGDQRDLIEFEHPSTRYMQKKIDIEVDGEAVRRPARALAAG